MSNKYELMRFYEPCPTLLAMGLKICRRCGAILPIVDFIRNAREKDGHQTWCTTCKNAFRRKWRRENPEANTQQNIRYKNKLGDEYKAIRKRRMANWIERNPNYMRDYKRRMRAENPQFKVRYNMASRLSTLLKSAGVVKTRDMCTMKLIGCTLNELMTYIEGQFADGMTWKNYGEWHVDHIIPCRNFDLTNEADRKRCFHYTNLQPLWASDNLSKSDLLEGVSCRTIK